MEVLEQALLLLEQHHTRLTAELEQIEAKQQEMMRVRNEVANRAHAAISAAEQIRILLTPEPQGEIPF